MAGMFFGNTILVHADENGRQQHKRIMLVDDERHITNALKRGLESEGFVVDTFNNPLDALVQFRRMIVNNNNYDLIILDVRMSHMNGFELAREIWQIDNEAKVCFLTAYVAYENEATSVFPNLRDYCFIQKPISISELARIIKQRLLME